MGGLAGDIGADLPHGDADIGRAQGRGIVDAVAGHGHEFALVLQGSDDLDLLLRGHPGIEAHRFDLPRELRQAHARQFRPGQDRAVGLGDTQTHGDGARGGGMVARRDALLVWPAISG